ncbi:hypothetical protein PRZ48_007798 [Zasmidium cellare]|uniref:Uncharacterized protein n=1 Tax=Zasmidium cellare TaxID=395010 RepID=A0ABR0EKH8_ZASCE|nr:hypothetical protein PRZ48_007798 [Zasmidium cellare]
MAPRPTRYITLLETHPRSALPDNEEHYRSKDRVTGPSPPPRPTWTHTAEVSLATKTNAASQSRAKIHRTRAGRTSKRGDTSSTTLESLTTTPKSSTDSKTTDTQTVIEYSSTTTIYTSGFATSTRSETPAPSTTIAGPPVHRTRVDPYGIPDPPVWFPYMIAALLAIMLALAVLFYFVNFPPTGRWIRENYQEWKQWLSARRNQRYGYEKVEEIQLDSNDCRSSGASPTLRQLSEITVPGKDDAVSAAFTTSANTPGLHNTPTLYSRRRKGEGMNVDTDAAAGLGITLTAETPSGVRQQKSFDDTLLRPNTDKPLPQPPKTPARQAVQSAKAFLPRITSRSELASRKLSTDLETGLLRPPRRNPLPPTSSPTPSAPPSPGYRVLEMVGGSVEYAAEKMSKFMHDQVKGNPEEGLLLPVRDCEREKVLGEVVC